MRDWNTGEGFTNGLTQDDILYLRWAIASERDDAYQRGREDAAKAIAVLEPTQDYGFLRLWRDEAIVAARGGKADGSEFRSPIVWTRSNIVINVSGNASEADIRAAIAAACGDGERSE